MKNKIIELVDLLGENNVLQDAESKLLYGKDRTQNYSPNPLAIIFPNSEADVIAIVKFANEHKISIVPSGGRTGYSGGAVAKDNELVVSFEKMNRIIDFNADDRQITCEAGVTTKTIQDIAIQHGLYYPIDYAVVDTCQIGGNIATNAGGIHVIRYGSTSKWVAGLRVITGKGELLELNHGLIKNSSGYDLRQLFIGSEGTLGFIVSATLQLTTPPKKANTIFLAVKGKHHLINILNVFREILSLIAFEFFDQISFDEVIAVDKTCSPFKNSAPYYVLIDYEIEEFKDQKIINAIEACFNKEYISDFIISKDEEEKKYFWSFRLGISTSLVKYSPYKYDIAVLPSKISVFMDDINALFQEIYSNLKTVWWGHVGDGNLHLNILRPENLTVAEFFTYCQKASIHVYKTIQKHKGTVSAEHGIGLLKKPFLSYSKSETEITYMRNIKKIFDPNNIMNRGKLI
jgi:FAD/FMN-containing dehydrogenase